MNYFYYNRYCAKLTAAVCATDADCIGIPGSVCMPSSKVCGCGASTCLDPNDAVCIDETLPNALRERPVGHPCLGLTDSRPPPFVAFPDFTLGNPWDRCILLSENSYLRVDYMQPRDLTTAQLKNSGSELSYEVSAWLHVAFSVLEGFEYNKLLTTRMSLVGLAGMQIEIIDDSAALVNGQRLCLRGFRRKISHNLVSSIRTI